MLLSLCHNDAPTSPTGMGDGAILPRVVKALAVFSRAALLLAVVGTLASVRCSGSKTSSNNSGGNGSPTSPSANGSGSSCRTFPTAVDVAGTVGNVTVNMKMTGAFNASTHQSTITNLLSNGSTCTTHVYTYDSNADFVDENRVIPSVSLVKTGTTTSGPGCGTGMFSVAFTYDAQRRLTSTVPAGQPVTIYTEWDSAGRPTKGSFPGTTIVNAYNDVTRTWTQTQTPASGGASTTTTTYDANGNQSTVVNSSASATSTTIYTTPATAQICK